MIPGLLAQCPVVVERLLLDGAKPKYEVDSSETHDHLHYSLSRHSRGNCQFIKIFRIPTFINVVLSSFFQDLFFQLRLTQLLKKILEKNFIQ